MAKGIYIFYKHILNKGNDEYFMIPGFEDIVYQTGETN
jgi:hypothetical protein